MKRFLVVLCAAVMVLLAVQVQGAPFTSDLSIMGEVYFDDGFALVEGGAAQSGSIDKTEGTVPTSAPFAGTTQPAPNPLMGTLTDFGDGFGMTGFADAIFDPTPDVDSMFAIGIDILIDVENTSATDQYQVFFRVDYHNLVDAMVDDAYANSEFTVDVDSSEVFFSDITSDTLFGNEKNGDPFPDPGQAFGGPVSDDGFFLFDIILDPLMTAAIDGAWTLEGGAFGDHGDMAHADFRGFISVVGVENLTLPPQVPEPATLVLLATGLGGLAAVRRRRKDQG